MSMPHRSFSGREDKSTIKIALLCLLVCATYQFAVSLVPWTTMHSYLKQPGSATASHPTVSITTIMVTQPTTVITTPTSTVIVTPSAISIPSAPTIAPQPEVFEPVSITPSASQAVGTVQGTAILPLLYPSDI
jgi:hypothetical protein